MRALKLAAAVILCIGCGKGAAGMNASSPRQEDIKSRLAGAYTKAADFLVSQQDKSGAWLQGPPGKAMPSIAYTSLVVSAFAGAPKEIREKYKDAIDKGAGFIASKRNDDGSFGEGPKGAFLKTYATALALQALHAADKEKHADEIRGAQAYLKQNQLKEGDNKGGSGYGEDEPTKEGMKKTIANLSTTGFTAEALKMSGLPQDDEFWKLCVEFVRKCQNNSETNKDPQWLAKLKEKGLSVGDDGGLYYAPVADTDVQKAKTKKIVDKEVIASYGSMTYEGIKTYIYAGLKKDSPEVKAAIDWVRKNYSVEMHPGFPFDEKKRDHLMGLFYYYMAMARAMDAIGENPFRTFDGKEHDWAKELGEQFLKTMKEGKMWVNDQPRWWEGDPILVTSFVLNTCDVLLRNIK